jgi:hypothetical protein
MILTQIELDKIKKQIRYEPETGQFFYLEDRFLERRFQKEMAAVKKLKVAHRAGDRADKIYGKHKQYVGVYVLDRVVNAAHLALYFITGHWPEAVRFKTGDWGDMTKDNLIPITRSEQTTAAALARHEGSGRKLPTNVYGTSSGKFVGRVGDKRTKEFESVRETLQAIRLKRWIN